jgi:eukaryotic-like serine/threonine-protein kinase
MEHEGARPDWSTVDEPRNHPTFASSSSFELIRSFDFRDSGESDCSPSSEQSVHLADVVDERLLSNFWSVGNVEAAPRARPRLKGTRVPEIPGYELLGELGRGAMGVVYRARQIRLNRQVALKMILAGDHAGPDTLARFLAEAATIARLKHPHIVQIYAIGDCEGRPYVELEYIEGGTLGARLDGTPWPPRAAARLLESLAGAAAEAHRLGIVHRDLKPANILMTDAGEPKISDFGLAKTLEEDSGLTRTESILGSPNYMAPEQADGRAKDVGPSADIYALGANLYELLTGRPPFVAPTVLATLDLVKNTDPVPPRRLQPHLPRDLETICLKCLDKEPRKRYETAQALADDLASFLADEPIKARRSPLWERVWKWVKRRPSSAALILVGTLALLGTGVGLEWRRVEVARLNAEAFRAFTALKARIDRFVVLGRDAMRREEWVAARMQLTTAKALSRSEPRLTSISDEIESMLSLSERKISGLQSRAAARQKFADFQRLYDEVVFYQSDYTGLDPEANIRAGRASARQALAKFGFGTAKNSPPDKANDSLLDPSHFDSREIEKINAECYELTLLLADSIAHALPGEDPIEQEREALAVLDTALRLRGLTPAFHLRRAAAFERLGERYNSGIERRLAAKSSVAGDSAVDQFLIGEQAYRQNDLKRAIESFRHSLAIQPDRFWAQYFLAVCLLKQHKPAEAQAALIACQSRRPGFVWSYLLKGFAEGEMREFDLAEEDFRRANELRLNDQERYVMLVNRGVMRIRRGDNQAAADDLKAAIALKPAQFEASINLAMAYQNLGRWDEALATLGEAITGHPREAVLYRARSQVYRLRSRTDEALKDLQRAIELVPPQDPASATDHLEQALILQQAGRFEESLAACDQALRLKPNQPEPHRVRAVALMMLKRYDEAARSFDVCLVKGSASPALYEARGLALASLGSYDRALADYTMALNIGKGTSSLYANRGWVYLLSGAASPALHDFDEALRLDPSSGHALSGRALSKIQLRKTREAVADARSAVGSSPDDARLIYNAARVFCQAAGSIESSTDRGGGSLADAGQYRIEALRHLGRAVELCPPIDRARFWNDVICKDASLEPIRRSRSFMDLATRAQAVPSVTTQRGEGAKE